MTALWLLLIATNVITTTIEAALSHFEAGEYREAAVLLDEAAGNEPDQFDFNNLFYLRGRIAEAELDWGLADAAFSRIGRRSVLHDLAVAHRARAALERDLADQALELLDQLPNSFPVALRVQLAETAPRSVALDVLASIETRTAQWIKAEARDNEPEMWRLLERNQNDEVALKVAARLDRPGLSADQRMQLAETFHTHRVFDRAEALYRSLLEDPDHGGPAHYQLGRTYFQRSRYEDAIGVFRATVIRFPGSDWANEARSQIATSYWRLLDYPTAAASYAALLETYRNDPQRYHSAVRDLIDIYRASGQTDRALTLIQEALQRRPSATDRTVLTFTRAKVYFREARFDQALEDFRLLERMNLRAVPNGTDLAEIRFFQALTLERLGQIDQAQAIWSVLSREPFTYYGLKAVEKLNDPGTWSFSLEQAVQKTMRDASGNLCQRGTEQPTRNSAHGRRLSATRGILTEPGETDRVGELVFLRLWDEAFFWAELTASRWSDQALADLAFLASDFRRAMLYADRLRPADERVLFTPGSNFPDAGETDELLAMLYPTGFGEIICRESSNAGTDPIWLQAIIWQESRYDPQARSGAAARGLMQFIPETALEVSANIGMEALKSESLYQPEVSIRLGAHYWSALLQAVEHPEMALAAYNGGLVNVSRWSAKSDRDVELFVADIGFVETKTYVRRIFELYAKYAYLSSSKGNREDTIESQSVAVD